MTDQLFDGYKRPSPTADQAPTNYYVWLLRLWREHPDEAWRVVLQCTDGERIGFPELKNLFEYLRHLTDEEEGRT